MHEVHCKEIFTLILVGLVLPDCLVSCILRIAFCVLSFAKSTGIQYYSFFEHELWFDMGEAMRKKHIFILVDMSDMFRMKQPSHSR